MSVSSWDVNRKISWNKLLKDVKSGKYKGAKIKEVDNKWGFFTINYNGLYIDVDRDGLISKEDGSKKKGYTTGIADRFDVTLPSYNDHFDLYHKFLEVLEKEYGSKFMDDFEMDSPEKEWEHYTEVPTGPISSSSYMHAPAHKKTSKKKDDIYSLLSSGQFKWGK